MPEDIEIAPPEPGSGAVAKDRRRPGRFDYDSPELIALMRGQAPSARPAMPDTETRPAAGGGMLKAAIIFCIFIWLAIMAVFWMVS